MSTKKNLGSIMILALGGATTIGCTLADDGLEDLDVGVAAQGVMCGADNRTAVTSLTYPRGAIGNVNGGCSGVIIATNKVMTAQHCIGNNQPSQMSFSPQYGIVTPGTGPASSKAVRMTLGRDEGDHERYADWAILTFSTNFQTQLGSNFQKMNRVMPSTSPFSMTLAGYHGDLFSQRPGIESCTARTNSVDGATLHHTCDVQGGASGGPIWTTNGTSAQLVGIQSGHGSGTCAGDDGNSGASGTWYSYAPDNAVGLATALTGNGRLRVFATDQDWSLVGYREKKTTDSSGPWTPWGPNDSAFSGGRKMAAVNLADGRQQLFVVTSTGQVKTRWQSSVDGSFGSWSTMSMPTTVADIATTGGKNVPTHLFILGTDGSVRYTYKAGNASSNWSSWATIGTLTGAKSLSANTFGGVHQIYVVSSAGARTAWGGSASFTGLNDFGTVTGGFKTVGAGVLQDGRANAFAVSTSGTLYGRIRGTDGNWSAWAAMPQGNPLLSTGFVTLATGRLTDGREQVFGVGSDGNVYTLWETSGGSFNGTWSRFYK